MDIFSSTSKQVESAVQTKKPEATTQTREVENSHQMAKTAKDAEQNQEGVSEKLTETVGKLNEQMKTLGTNVEFGFNDEIEIMFVDVVEISTGEVIRKIPTEEAMKLSERMQEVIGTIFDKEG